MTLRLEAVWGGSLGRSTLAEARVLLGTDPAVIYALGRRGDALILEAWSAETGVRTGACVVSGCGQLRTRRVLRGEGPDEVIVALRTLDANEVGALDLRTGSFVARRRLAYDDRGPLCASRDLRCVLECSAEGDVGLERGDGSWTDAEDWQAGASDDWAITQRGRFSARHRRASGRVIVERTERGVVTPVGEVEAGGRHAHLVFSEDEEALWGLFDGELSCWEVPSMAPVGRWSGASQLAEIVAVSATGRAALVDGPLAFAAGEAQAVSPRAHRWTPELARLAPDGRRLAFGPRGALGWHDLARDDRVELHTGGHAGAVLSLAVSPDGRAVASSATDRSIRVWDAARGDTRWTLEGDAEGFCALGFAPDARSLYAVTYGHAPRLTAWDLDEGAEVTPAHLEVPSCERVEVSPDGGRLVASNTSWQGDPAALVDLARFERIAWNTGRRFTRQGEVVDDATSAGPVAFDPDGRLQRLLVRYEAQDPSRLVAVRARAGDGGVIDEVQAPDAVSALRHAAFATGGRWLAGAGDDGSLWLFDARADYGLAQRPWRGLPRPARLIACAERRAAFADDEGVISLWDFETRVLLEAREGLRATVTALAFSPDGATIYAGTDSGQVRRYRIE